jgi:hypothetical protein
MSRPVVHTQFGNLAVTRAKLLFIETMTTDPGLTPLSLRAGIIVLSTYTTKRGYAETSVEHVALALGADKGNVSRALRAAELWGYFRIERSGYKHGVRGKPNRYYPNWAKVTSLQPMNDAAAARKVVSEAADEDALGCISTPNKVVSTTTNPDYDSIKKSCAPQRATRSERRTDIKHQGSLKKERPEHTIDSEFLRRTEAFIKLERPRPFTDSELATLGRWFERCNEIFEEHDVEDPIAQWGRRLADEIGWILDEHLGQNEPPSRSPESEKDRPIAPGGAGPEKRVEHAASDDRDPAQGMPGWDVGARRSAAAAEVVPERALVRAGCSNDRGAGPPEPGSPRRAQGGAQGQTHQLSSALPGAKPPITDEDFEARRAWMLRAIESWDPRP